MYEEAPTASVDELFRIITIDRKRKVKMTVQLRDAAGDEVPIRETIEKLTEYVGDKMKEDGHNTCKQQIMPMMAQAVVGGLVKLMNEGPATYMLSQEHIRFSLVHMMIVSFYMFKWIQKKQIKIHTTEEDITDEDIAMYDRVSTASDVSVMAAAHGGDPKEVLRQMIDSGQLKKEDLDGIGFELDTKQKKHEVN